MLIIWTIWGAAIHPAQACAGLFHDDETIAESDAQEAIFTVGVAGQTTVSYRADYQGDAASFGWVIPIPAGFLSLEDGDNETFNSLEDQTGPVATWDYGDADTGSGGSICGCGAASKGGGDFANLDTATGGVDIVAEGYSGTYTYTVIEATDSTELLAWLAENGWSVRESADIIASYVADGGYQFVALTLTPDTATTPEEGRELPPVNITYASEEIRYPSRMGGAAMDPQLRTTIWILADHQYALTSGWTEATLDPITGDVTDDPTALFKTAVEGVSGDTAAYARTWSGGTSGSLWVTRFDTLANREVHTVDAVFGQAAADEEMSTSIALTEGGTTSAALVLPVAAMAYGWLRRRRALMA